MSENKRIDDAQFAQDVLKSLPTTAVSAALEARLLADFDRVAATVRRSFLRLLGERLWPGVPAWQPVSVLALSLAAGLMVGIFVPSPSSSLMSDAAVVASIDATPDMDFNRDI